VTDQTFAQEVEGAAGVVLVDFWADWCAPCKAMEPVLDEIAAAFAGKAKVIKVNIDDNIDTPTRLGVMNIPTFIAFKNGVECERLVGFTNKQQLTRVLERALA